ncbi:MAG: addiction module toxin, HicA family [Symploca sp. SIO2E6]|nr:addiction module toxin, HicA family [Symploca sp. SIO2E6]
MGKKYPVLKPSEVVTILEKLGFQEVRQRGAHKQMRHPDGRGSTVPCHKGRDLSPIILRQIAKDIDLTVDELLKYR